MGDFVSVKAALSDLLCVGVKGRGGGRRGWYGVLTAAWTPAGAGATVDLIICVLGRQSREDVSAPRLDGLASAGVFC